MTIQIIENTFVLADNKNYVVRFNLRKVHFNVLVQYFTNLHMRSLSTNLKQWLNIFKNCTVWLYKLQVALKQSIVLPDEITKKYWYILCSVFKCKSHVDTLILRDIIKSCFNPLFKRIAIGLSLNFRSCSKPNSRWKVSDKRRVNDFQLTPIVEYTISFIVRTDCRLWKNQILTWLFKNLFKIVIILNKLVNGICFSFVI